MTVPSSCIQLVERWESFRASPYLCPAGVPTVGYGSTRRADDTPVALTDHPISEAEAEALMLAELEHCLASVDRLCPGLNDNQRGALASFVYNLGAGRLKASTLREYVNEGNYAAAAGEFGKWVMAGGRRLPGLVARRAEEARLFSSDQNLPK